MVALGIAFNLVWSNDCCCGDNNKMNEKDIGKCKECGQEIPKDFRKMWLKYLKGKEVRGDYFGRGSFSGNPDCYKFKDIKEAFERFEEDNEDE